MDTNSTRTYLSFERNDQRIYEFIYRLFRARRRFDQSLTSKEEKTRMERRKRRRRKARLETVSFPDSFSTDKEEGNIAELEGMCKYLLTRTGHAIEGQEPWRLGSAARGLLWNMSDCDNQAESILGNHLSRWYMFRAVAAAAGIAVQMNCPSPLMDHIQTKLSPFDTILDENRRKPFFSWREFCESCDNDPFICRYPHAVTNNGLERVRRTIRSDLRTMAFNVLLSGNQNNIVNELDDVTIHLRVGDIGRQDHTRYGLVPFKVYKKIVPETAESIGIVTAPF